MVRIVCYTLYANAVVPRWICDDSYPAFEECNWRFVPR